LRSAERRPDEPGRALSNSIMLSFEVLMRARLPAIPPTGPSAEQKSGHKSGHNRRRIRANSG
jgi:hypothetical protein